MHVRTRKLVGTVVLVPMLIIYCLLAMWVGSVLINQHSGFVQLLYYVVAGFVWIAPAALLIRWMGRPQPGDPEY